MDLIKSLEECCIHIATTPSVMLGIKSGVADLLEVFTQVNVLTDQKWASAISLRHLQV